MAETTVPYVVRAGDYLAKVAHLFGFDADTVWNLPENEELRTKRPNPNVLYPGDVLRIPKREGEGVAVEGGTENTYAAPVPTSKISIVLYDPAGGLFASKRCIVRDIPNAPESTTAEGKLEFDVPVTLRLVIVEFPDDEVILELDVGGLDPGSEDSGVKHRLRNLGIYCDDGVESAENDERYANALRVFQQRAGLPETGELDDGTRAALLSEHLV
ncbi:MAG: peptidoglycan-binding protein [Polyangiaceae bacterium]